jgi:hypothetical protein
MKELFCWVIDKCDPLHILYSPQPCLCMRGGIKCRLQSVSTWMQNKTFIVIWKLFKTTFWLVCEVVNRKFIFSRTWMGVPFFETYFLLRQ